MDLLALLEWPAMAISLAAAWWMGSRKPGKRIVAFCMLIVGKLKWIAWGWGEDARAHSAQCGFAGIQCAGHYQERAAVTRTQVSQA
jgi:hypothetical protein